jgi:tight adherence protein C
VAGLLLGDWLLGRAARRRRRAIAEQFPVAAQLLALLISAGASPSDAIGRVARAIGGPLGAQFEAAQRTAAGGGFAAGMRQMSADVELPVIERFVQGLLSAIERGSPLAEIVREQAIDASAESHRQLMTEAGKRDIAMLVPVVFAVLPTVVMVSLLPGAAQLGLFGG